MVIVFSGPLGSLRLTEPKVKVSYSLIAVVTVVVRSRLYLKYSRIKTEPIPLPSKKVSINWLLG